MDRTDFHGVYQEERVIGYPDQESVVECGLMQEAIAQVVHGQVN
jgi:hypothetical protein